MAAVPLLAGLLLVTAAAPAGSALDNPIANICHAEQHLAAGPAQLTILPGMGDGGFPIRANPQAQAWFDYGVKLFHAFYHDDAKKAFDNAVAADPDCAMCLWGQALSRGSNQNFDAKPESIADGLAMAKKAKDEAKTPLEQALAQAMITRFEAKPDAAAETMFAQAILRVARQDPNNIDLPLLALGGGPDRLSPGRQAGRRQGRGDHHADPQARARQHRRHPLLHPRDRVRRPRNPGPALRQAPGHPGAGRQPSCAHGGPHLLPLGAL